MSRRLSKTSILFTPSLLRNSFQSKWKIVFNKLLDIKPKNNTKNFSAKSVFPDGENIRRTFPGAKYIGLCFTELF